MKSATKPKLANHQLINQNSGDTEYLTPLFIVDAARATMGGIELDPASSEAANRRVKAVRFYTKEQDGLKQSWDAASVWLNHPFAKAEDPCKPNCQKKTCQKRGHCLISAIPGNADWINKLVAAYEFDLIERAGQACCITFAATSEQWFQPLLNYPQCFLSPRTNYERLDGRKLEGVSKGSVVTYLGPNKDKFVSNFRIFGRIK